jgi:hypothetical protein
VNCYRANRDRLSTVIDEIVREIRAYPPALRQLGRDWWADLGPDPHNYHSAPDATPLLHLPIWMAEGRRATTPLASARLNTILAAAAQLYFHIRIQDNVLDEPETRGRTRQLLLGNVFVMEAWERLRGLRLSDRFWTWANEAWRIFSEQTEAERRQAQSLAPYSFARFRRHARKVAVARIPLYAVVDGDKTADKDAIDRFIDRLGEAYGLVNDVLGVERDLLAEQRTYLIATVEQTLPKRSRSDPARVRRALLKHPHLEQFLEKAVVLHRRLRPLGEALGVSHMGDYTDERIERLRHHHARALELRLRFALSGNSWPVRRGAAKD